MRSTGALTSPEGVRSQDHVCWAFDGPERLVAAALPYFAEGLDLGARISFVGAGSVEWMREALSPLGGVDDLLARGELTLIDADAGYGSGWRTEPVSQVDRYAAAVEAAVAEGFSGLRVAADVSDLVIDPTDRDAFVRYEHLMDRRMADGLPFTALCGYDRTRVSDEVIDEVTCVHPLHGHQAREFVVHAGPDAQLVLAGEADVASAELLARTLARVLPGRTGRVEVDCAGLTFVDHRSLLTLDRAAAEAGVTLELVGAGPLAARLAGLIELPHLEVHE